MYLIGMLVLLFLANIAMLMGMTNWPARTREGFAASMGRPKARKEGFMDYFTTEGSFISPPIGPYDNVNLAKDLPPASQGFRQTSPDVPLRGPPINIDENHLLYFANNQCKPECCSSSMSCDGGGCVCTTPDQRDFINCRGGNRCSKGEKSDDGF